MSQREKSEQGGRTIVSINGMRIDDVDDHNNDDDDDDARLHLVIQQKKKKECRETVRNGSYFNRTLKTEIWITRHTPHAHISCILAYITIFYPIFVVRWPIRSFFLLRLHTIFIIHNSKIMFDFT